MICIKESREIRIKKQPRINGEYLDVEYACNFKGLYFIYITSAIWPQEVSSHNILSHLLAPCNLQVSNYF
jgi:hypothetical protein